MDKAKLNTILKLGFILSAFVLLITLANVPKTDCDVCSFDFGDKKVNGDKAWSIIEEECISYIKPWEDIYIDIDYLNVSEDENGMQIIKFTKEGKEKMDEEELDLYEDIED